MKIFIAITTCMLLSYHSSVAQSKVATLTYLKSIDGEKNNLKEFLKRNWLVMDSIAKKQDLILDYALWENKENNQDWDLIVFVKYKDDNGYEGIANSFEYIRSNHKKILIQNKDLKQLGKIVRTETINVSQ